MHRIACLSLVLCGVLAHEALAQSTMDDVFLFRNFNQDARVPQGPFLDGSMLYNTFPMSSYRLFSLGAGTAFSPNIEGGASVSYVSVAPDFGPGTSGLSDPTVHVRYNLSHGSNSISAGAFVTLPIGSEEVGEGDLDLGIFAAARHPLREGTVLTGKVSADYFDVDVDDRGLSFRFHAGVIQQAAEQIALLAELLIGTDVSLAQLSGGVDYNAGSAGRVRGSLAVGLNDNSPDFSLVIAFLHLFGR